MGATRSPFAGFAAEILLSLGHVKLKMPLLPSQWDACPPPTGLAFIPVSLPSHGACFLWVFSPLWKTEHLHSRVSIEDKGVLVSNLECFLFSACCVNRNFGKNPSPLERRFCFSTKSHRAQKFSPWRRLYFCCLSRLETALSSLPVH